MERKRLRTTAVASLVIALGVVLRLAGFFANRSLWGDEVAVALNLRFRDFPGLLRPLDYQQTMPMALLVGIKSIMSVLGSSEFALRLIFLIAGCLFLVVLWITFDRFFGRAVALIGLGLAALWQPLIYYSSELKQYGCDALITAITLWFAFSTIKGKDSSRWPGLIVWGAAAILLSQPAVFVLTAVGVAAVLDRRIVYSKMWRIYCGIAAACWLTEFAALFQFSYRYTSGSAFMRSYWASSFLDPSLPGFRQNLLMALWTMLGNSSFPHVRSLVLVVVAGAGLYGIWRSGGIQSITIAAGPYGLLFGAALLRQYPIAARLILFAVPLLFWIYASGLTTIAALVPRKFRVGAVMTLALAMLGPMAVTSIRYVIHFPQREATRQILAQMNAADPGAPVYLAFSRYLQWAYYAGDWSQPEMLKERIARAFSCGSCTDLTYPGSARRTEIVGARAADQPDAVADEQWASQEAGRIANSNSNYIWVFLPIYDDIYKPRKLLEMLSGKLREHHAYPVNEFAVGDTIALRYALNRM